MQRKTPIVLGGVCPLAWATTDKLTSKISRYLSITTHTPPKITGACTYWSLSEMPISTAPVYQIIPTQAKLVCKYGETATYG
jgi:hypothetical protein